MCSAKDVANSAGLGSIDQESDISIVLRWVYYHDVLSRFSLRHWRLRKSAEAAYFRDFNQLPDFHKPFNASPKPRSRDILMLTILLAPQSIEVALPNPIPPTSGLHDHTKLLGSKISFRRIQAMDQDSKMERQQLFYDENATSGGRNRC
jgi:hypothetical protein